jgi:hypothetical protein
MATQLRHLRSGDADKRPAPEEMVAGQIAINYSTGSPGLFFRNAAGAIQKVGPTHIGLTAPNSSPAGSPGVSVGESWLDTSLTPPVFKIWNGVEWVVSVGPEGPAGPQGEPGADSTVPGPQGEPGIDGLQGPPGPSAVSADAGNTSVLGSDGLVYTPIKISADTDNFTTIGSDGGIYTSWEETELGELVVLITQDLNLYVATTGNDETGDGTQALPWATPHRAMVFLSKCVLASGVTATVHMADGLYEFTVPLNLNHPQGTQIYINGTSTTGTRPTGAALNGGGVRGNTAATKSFNEAKLDAHYNTKWLFKDCIGVKCSLGGGVRIDKVLIKGDGSAGNSCVIAGNRDAEILNVSGAGSGAINFGETVAIHGFGNTAIVCQLGGSVFASNATLTNCQGSGISATYLGSVNIQYGTISNFSGEGIVASSGSAIQASDGYFANNERGGIVAQFGGVVEARRGAVTNNGREGCRASFGGVVRLDSAVVTGNGREGVYVISNGAAEATGATVTGNGLAGLSVADSGSILAVNTKTASNTGRDVLVTRAGYISYVGGDSTDLSPAANTVGNGNGYIAT